MRLLKTHSHTSNGLAMEPGTREEKQLKETQTLQQGKSHPPKTCHVPPVWRGGAEKALEPAAYRRCGGGGQERLYGKPATEKFLWRGEPSSIWRGTQAQRQGGSHAKNLPRTTDMERSWTKKRQIPAVEGGRTYSPARGGSALPKKQSRTNTTHKKKDDIQART